MVEAWIDERGNIASFELLNDVARNPAFKADVLARIAALHRVGQPTDVTGAIVFLASPAAALITGHTILIDGGWTAR